MLKLRSDTLELAGNELTAYNAAFETIYVEFLKMEQIKADLNQLAPVRWERPNPKAFDSVTTSNGKCWNAYALLLKLPKSEILLCCEAGEWAVIQRFQAKGIYAQTHGETEILLKGNNVREVVTEYTAQADHTLKFMARNLVAKAQRVVWEQFPDHNPSLVVRAISKRCSQAVESNQAIRETQDKSVRQSRGIGI